MRKLLIIFAMAVTAGVADAQTVVIQQRPGAAEQKNEIRVQVSVSVFVPGAVNATEASLKLQEDTRRNLYDAAGRECGVLKSSFASDCRLESVNVNINRNYGHAQTEGFTATGNFGFKVTAK